MGQADGVPPLEGAMVCHAGNWLDPQTLGRHVSALANGAAYLGIEGGRFVWGVDPSTHEACGTTFDHHLPVDGKPLEVWLSRRLSPAVPLAFAEHDVTGFRAVTLEVARAKGSPAAFEGTCHVWLAGRATPLASHPQVEAFLLAKLAHEGGHVATPAGLSAAQRAVLEELRRDPRASKVRVAERIGRSVSTVDRAVSFLRASGCLERVGANRNGRWVVLDATPLGAGRKF